MKILIITEWFFPHFGGMETLLYNFIKHSPQDSFVVYAPETPNCREFDKKQDFEVIRSRPWADFIGAKIFKRFILAGMMAQSAWIIATRKADAVVFSSLHLYMGAWADFLKFLFRKPSFSFVFAEGIEPTLNDPRVPVKMLARFVRTALRNTDRLIAGSDYTVNKLLSWSVPRQRIIKNLPCVDTEVFRPGLDSKGLLQKLGIIGKKIILTVARLEERKGIGLVIKAMPEVLRRVPEAVYVVVGQGGQEQALRQSAKEANVSDKVVFAGSAATDDLPLYYNLCDVFVLANRALEEKHETEGFGLVFLEANACAKPVIGGKSGGVTEAIVDKVTGLLIDPEDKSQLTAALIALLSDDVLARSMGQAGRLRVEKEFSWQNYAADIRKEMVLLTEKK